MGTQRGSLGVAADASGVFAIGGYNSKSAVRSTELLDTAVNLWRPLPDMQAERVALCALNLDSQVRVGPVLC